MGKQTVEALIEGGKATAAPPLGSSLGPLGVNIGQIVADINKKTADFKGMKVPVKVVVDEDTKEYEISIGTPPASALIKSEAKIQKGSGNPLADKVADLKIEQVIKVAKMKEDSLLGNGLKNQVKEIIGTCNSMGILVEGKQAREVIHDIDGGAFADEIASGKTELSAEELKELEAEKKKLQEEVEARRTEFLATANATVKEMEGKTRNAIKAKLVEQGIPAAIIEEVLPAETAAPKADAAPAKK